VTSAVGVTLAVRPSLAGTTHLGVLQDLENSAGSWDLYGTEDERRYPGLQAEFFQRAAAPLRRREAILGFVGIGKSDVSCLFSVHVGLAILCPGIHSTVY
jgi:hypothetical protein